MFGALPWPSIFDFAISTYHFIQLIMCASLPTEAKRISQNDSSQVALKYVKQSEYIIIKTMRASWSKLS